MQLAPLFSAHFISMRFLSPDARAVPVVRLSLLSAAFVSLLFLSTLLAVPQPVHAQDAVPDDSPAAVDAASAEDATSADDAPHTDDAPNVEPPAPNASADVNPTTSADAATGEDAVATPPAAAAPTTDEELADAIRALETPADQAVTDTVPTEDEAPTPVPPISDSSASVTGQTGTTAQPAKPQPSRVFADSVRYEGGLIIAESQDGKGVRLEGEDAQGQPVRVWADKIIVDTTARTLRAQGNARVERTRQVQRRGLDSNALLRGRQLETVTETLRGTDFQYNFGTQQGSLDKVKLQLVGFDVSAESLIINGRTYTASNVILRPGGLTEEETRIYGTPPFNIRARSATFDVGLPRPTSVISNGNADVSTGGSNQNGPSAIDGRQRASADPAAPRITVRGGALYFRNTRLFPIPSYVFRRINLGPREEQAYTLTPRITFSSVDGVLVTTRLVYPLSQKPDALTLNADLGVSARIGLRGGLSLEQPTRFGSFELSARKNDIVTAKLTNRIVLDRLPELSYNSPLLPLFKLPGNRLAGLRFNADIGRYAERTIGGGGGEVNSTREMGMVRFTTRGRNVEGPYLDLFTRIARYSNFDSRYRNNGFEVGYAGQLLPRVRGVISYSNTSIKGRTPFRFDRVDIRQELRTTFDIAITPRYLIPIDLRYDLSRNRFRDEQFGILRNYKTFAYGLTYSTAREQLRLEFRQGF
jgi:hypothetical protein